MLRRVRERPRGQSMPFLTDSLPSLGVGEIPAYHHQYQIDPPSPKCRLTLPRSRIIVSSPSLKLALLGQSPVTTRESHHT